jgi:hypothetical protein
MKWVYEGEAGFWHSLDARFEISPNFRHTANPDSYTLRDTLTGKRYSADTVRECKARSDRLAAKPDAADEARRQAAYEAANARHPLPISGSKS